MSPIRAVILVIGAAALCGCKINSYCTRAQSYDNAPSIPPLVGTGDLKIPTVNTALRVPEARPGSLTFGYVVADAAETGGRRKIECLDQPPPIPPSTDVAPTKTPGK